MFRSLLLAATLLTPLAAQAQGVAGPYLAGRVAGFTNDYAAAGDYFGRLLLRDRTSPQVLENGIVIFLVLGDYDRADRAADAIDAAGVTSQFASTARMISALTDARYDDARALLDGDGVGGALLDGLLGAWIDVAEGDDAAAQAAFETLAETRSFAPFAWLHEAYALALDGDYAGADAILSGEAHGPLPANTRGIAAHAQVLVQLDRRDDAAELLRLANDASNSPMLQDLARRVEAGEDVPFDLIGSARDGMAEAYFGLAALLVGETAPTFSIINGRAATALRPDHVDALVLVADLLEAQGQHALASAALAEVPRDDPSFFGAEIARADVLLTSDRDDAAIEVLRNLTRSNGDEQAVWTAYADALRRVERPEESARAYDRAIDLIGEVEPRDWFLFYARGIVREFTDDWAGAESDFREALDLNPGQPQVLNYLGYGLVEQRTKLDEALGMIEEAVAAQPDDGYITDSLGWAFYRLGRYDDAVAPMERAVMLEPLDPLINDHLGDVLWMVGREREARFQWRRALSLDPEEEVDRIKRKLEVGLDAVLEEEGGAGPIEAATD